MSPRSRSDNRPAQIIESMIQVAGRARTLLAAVKGFELGDPMREDLRARIEAARLVMSGLIRELDAVIVASSELRILCSEGDIATFLYILTTNGISRSYLDSRLKIDVYSGVAAAEGHRDPNGLRYFHEFKFPVKVETLMVLSPLEALKLTVDDICDSIETKSNFASKALYDREILQKLYLLKLVRFEPGKAAESDFPADNTDPDSGGGAGVPRRPFPPHFVGAAENEIPETENAEAVLE